MGTLAKQLCAPASLSERLLLRLSRKPDAGDCVGGQPEWTVGNALDKLCAMFPGLFQMIEGKEILDFGCGLGYQTAAMALRGAKRVVGVDLRADHLELASAMLRSLGLQERAEVKHGIGPELSGKFDLVISQNSMEHYTDPVGCLSEMARALKADGKILLTFGPPWYAPLGSHMHFFTRVPWVNILFSEKTVMSVRRNFRNDGATRYEEVEGGLNRMSLKKFDRVVDEAGLRPLNRRYFGVKRFDLPTKLPFLKELFTNNVASELVRK